MYINDRVDRINSRIHELHVKCAHLGMNFKFKFITLCGQNGSYVKFSCVGLSYGLIKYNIRKVGYRSYMYNKKWQQIIPVSFLCKKNFFRVKTVCLGLQVVKPAM